jgi:feruloyl esterase
MKMFMLNPPPGPSWSYTMFNFDTDPAKILDAAAIVNPQNPDLAPLKKRGGRIVQYAGWADEQVNPRPGIEYYETVSKRMGAAETREFYRMFMVPGMFHCNGGPGCGSADWLGVVTDWVEKGTVPAQIVGAHLEKGQTTRTRPLCPYPQVARDKGTGSIDEAANFSCVAP